MGAFVFLSGSTCLDFAATRKWRNSPDAVELLEQPVDLARWLVEAQIVDEAPVIAAQGFRRAIEVRESIYRVTYGLVRNRRFPPDDLMLVNESARTRPVDLNLKRNRLHRTGTLPQALSSIARDTLELVCGPSVQRLRQCNGLGCTRIFVDASRGGARRWCGMDECGNRVKAAAYRKRRSQ